MFRNLAMTKAESRLLAHICRMEGEGYEREIARGAGVSVGSANAILKRFGRAGIVLRSKRGRMSFFRRNSASPLLRQFRILMTVADLMPLVAEAAPLSRRITLLPPHSLGAESRGERPSLLIVGDDRAALGRVIGRHTAADCIAVDEVGFSLLWECDAAMRERVAEGFELHSG